MDIEHEHTRACACPVDCRFPVMDEETLGDMLRDNSYTQTKLLARARALRFPMMDEETLGDMLRDNGGHMERTCEQVQTAHSM